MTDQSVRRVGELTTTFLDALAVLLLAAGAGWWQWVTVHPAMGLAVAGAVVALLSQLAQRQATPRRVKQEKTDEQPLPGPSDPGNLHVMGR